MLIGLLVLGVAVWGWRTGQEAWQTMAVTTVIFAQVFQALAIRSNRESLFRTNLLSNKPLLGAIALIVGLQLVVIYLPLLHDLFNVVPLSPLQLAVTVLIGSVVLWAVEIEKAIRRRK